MQLGTASNFSVHGKAVLKRVLLSAFGTFFLSLAPRARGGDHTTIETAMVARNSIKQRVALQQDKIDVWLIV